MKSQAQGAAEKPFSLHPLTLDEALEKAMAPRKAMAALPPPEKRPRRVKKNQGKAKRTTA